MRLNRSYAFIILTKNVNIHYKNIFGLYIDPGTIYGYNLLNISIFGFIILLVYIILKNILNAKKVPKNGN
jgi:cell shape-determining protein MreD